MSLAEYQWKSFDGLDLYAVQWNAKEQPEAVIAFVHGHGDHCRRYDDWFSMLTVRNIAVLSFDYRGHGRSQGRRGVISRFDELLKDVSLLHEKAKALFPGIPVILFGNSLGATIVLSYILRAPMPPDLAIAISPWLELKKPPDKWSALFLGLGNLIVPFLSFRTGLRSLDFSAIDRDSENREKDELTHNRISARFFTEVELEIKWIQTHFTDLKTPLLLMQGRDDLIMKSSATRKLNEGAPGQVNYREWKNAGHQLHNSERSIEVIDYLIDWIKVGI